MRAKSQHRRVLHGKLSVQREEEKKKRRKERKENGLCIVSKGKGEANRQSGKTR